MKYLLGFFIFFVFAILQTTLVFFGEIHGAKPDLLFIFLVYTSLFFGRRWGMFVGFTTGLFYDLYEPQYIGLNAMIHTSIGFLIGSLSERLYRERTLSQFLTLFFASLLANLLLALFLSRSSAFLHRGILGSLYTSFFGIFLFILFSRFFERWKQKA